MDENYQTSGKCLCGIESYWVTRTQFFHGHGDIAVGGDWWHTEEEICPRGSQPPR